MTKDPTIPRAGLDRDRSTVKKVREGDLSAFDEIYRENWVMIKDLVMKNSGTQSEAEDIYQDAMIVLLRRFRSEDFELNARISTFLYSVVRNLWLKKLRRPVIEEPTDGNLPDVAQDLAQNEVIEERLSAVKRALDQLGEKCREIIELFYMKGASMDDIAHRLGYTNSANAKNQKYKCFKQLKSRLNER